VSPEELQKLVDEISGELAKLADDPEKPLGRADRKHRLVLLARKEALERVKTAVAEGNVIKETQASLDYGLLTEYGERHPLIFNFMRAQTRGWRWW